MVTFNLTPVDNNYLTSNLLFKQLVQNAINLQLETANATAVNTPKIHLDGSGRALLSGSFTLIGTSPTSGTPLFSLPSFLSIPNEIVLNASIDHDGVITPVSIYLESNTSGIKSVTITNPGSYATIPTVGTSGSGTGATFSTSMKALTVTPITAQSGAGSYAPNDTITAAGGTFSMAFVATVSSTKVVSATIAAGGTGGTTGTQTVTGTTGTGTKFTASVTITGGAITAVLSILTGGVYTVNPTVLTNEPVTGAGLTGAALSVVMGVNAASVTTSGAYTALPTSPIAQAATSGSGTGATFSATWGLLNIGVLTAGQGYDSSSQIMFTGGGGAGGGAASITLGQADTQVVALLGASASQNDIIYIDGANFLVNSYN